MAKILVVDDSPTVAMMVAAALGADGHVVERMEQFFDLPRLLLDDPPDLVLLDLRMPALSGVEVGRFMRRNQRRHIPIIIHSAQPESELEQVAAELGAVGFIRKGISPENLRTTIARQLSRR